MHSDSWEPGKFPFENVPLPGESVHMTRETADSEAMLRLQAADWFLKSDL